MTGVSWGRPLSSRSTSIRPCPAAPGPAGPGPAHGRSRGTGPPFGEGGNGLIVVGAQGAADKIADGIASLLDDKDHTFFIHL